jgi:hypothetical protein
VLEIELNCPDFPWSEEEMVSPLPPDARVVVKASPDLKMVAKVVEWEDRKPDVRQERFLHTMLDARQQEVPRSGKLNLTQNEI